MWLWYQRTAKRKINCKSTLNTIKYFILSNKFMTTITFTDKAQDRIIELLLEEDEPNLKLRMFIQGGGCSGLQYGFTFDNEQSEDDIEIPLNNSSKGKTSVLVDLMSLNYIQGAEVDFVENVMGETFQVKNPNTITTCGCGSSFAV